MEIIANIGFNWWTKGDISERTTKLVTAAVNNGADSICIPMFEAEKVHRVDAAIATFRRFNTPREIILHAKDMADNANIGFIVAPTHHDQIEYLEAIGADRFHLQNGYFKYWPLIEKLVEKQVLFSTGLATFSEVDAALEKLMYKDDAYEFNYSPSDMAKVTLLHSTGARPTPDKEAQLTRILDLQSEFFPMNVGLESFFRHRLLDFVSMTFRPTVIMRRLDLGDHRGTEASYSITPDELNTLVDLGHAMDIVNNPEIYAEEFVEGDWEARVNEVRCESVDYTLPPEH